AGTISFVTNIILATLLFIPLGGKGIAFSLSAASMVQTVFLWMFLKRSWQITIPSLYKTSLYYGVKITLFSVIALVPTWASSFF
ncbi:lipid II flippase MurJ, partial [Treponema pallidum]